MDHLIKRIIKKTFIEKFFNSMFFDLDLDNLESMVIIPYQGEFNPNY